MGAAFEVRKVRNLECNARTVDRTQVGIVAAIRARLATADDVHLAKILATRSGALSLALPALPSRRASRSVLLPTSVNG